MNAVDGPFFEDFHQGQQLDPAPDMTIGAGEAAVYQSIIGDPIALSLSTALATEVTGEAGALANPSLVLQIGIGQSTVATRRVIANLFYRGLKLARPVRIGETLHTTVEIRALKETTRRPDRAPRGLGVLGITTTAVEVGDVLIDFERCGLFPFAGDAETGHADDTGEVGGDVVLADYEHCVPTGWNLAPLRARRRGGAWEVGEERVDPMRDTVTNATELARLIQNQAMAHRDAELGQQGQRLVYGGHTIGLAQASLGRLLPALVSVLGWHSCDHIGPVFENDLLRFRSTLLAEAPVEDGRIAAFSIVASADRGGTETDLLDYRPVVYVA